MVLIASAMLHCFGGFKVGFPALNSSNLDPALKTAFRVVFLSLGWQWLATFCWVAPVGRLLAGFAFRQRAPALLVALASCRDWIVVAIVALLARIAETKMRKVYVLLFGNEMIGTAALLLICGGVLFD